MTTDRRSRARRAVAEAGGDVFLAAHPSTVGWLTGVAAPIGAGPSPFALPPVAVLDDDGVHLLISEDQLSAAAPPQVQVTLLPGYTLGEPDPVGPLRAALAPRLAGRRVLAETAWVPVAVGAGREFAAGDRLFDSLRAVKDPDEIDQIRHAVAASVAGQRAVAAAVRPGVTELDLFAAARRAIDAAAGEAVPVVADLISGRRTARVEGAPSPRAISAGELVIADLVPRVGVYWGDTCSTVAAGEPSRAAHELHERVLDRVTSAVATARPGLSAGALDAVMRRGLDYPHHSGHGIGASFHEEPRIVPHSPRILAPGMVIALEPACYTEEVGVRLELVVEITEDGCSVLSEHSLALRPESGPPASAHRRASRPANGSREVA